MSDQPGSPQDPHQQPPQPPPGPPTPPPAPPAPAPGFSSGDPLGGSSGGTPPPFQPPPSAPAGPAEPGGFGPPSGGFAPPHQEPAYAGNPQPSFGGPQGELASWGQRALAVIIDGLILAIPVIIAIAILSALFASDDDGSSSGLFGGGIVLTIFASFLIQLAYYPFMLARQGDKNGQTIGKQVMNIRAVRLDGQQWQLGTAAIREIVGKVLPGSLCGLYTLVDYLWPLGDARNQAIHDKIGNSIVVRA